MADSQDRSADDAEPPHGDRGSDADRDLTLDPERERGPHHVGAEARREDRPDRPDELAEEEARAAAQEAGAIGGRGPSDAGDPAMTPVYQAGGGEAEGFEQAEERLIDNAEHGDFAPDPYNDRFPDEVESDRSGAAYGEADHERSSERGADRAADGDAESTS